jgi:hypothetical protein
MGRTAQVEPAELTELRRLCSKVPPAYQEWDVTRVREYKAALMRSNKVLGLLRPKDAAVTEAVASMRGFWQPKEKQ